MPLMAELGAGWNPGLEPAGAQGSAAANLATSREAARLQAEKILKNLLVKAGHSDQDSAGMASQWSQELTKDRSGPTALAAERLSASSPLSGLVDEYAPKIADAAGALSPAMGPGMSIAGGLASAAARLASPTARQNIQNFAAAMNPRSGLDGNQAAELNHFGSQYGDPYLGARASVMNRAGYPGAGWTAQEEQKLGYSPSKWELSDGDYMSYQRRLAAHTLKGIDDTLSRYDSGKRQASDQANYDAGAKNALDSVLADHARADETEGARYASGLLGSVYPWHRWGNAVSDALSSHASPIGRYMATGILTGDAAANAGMDQPDPVGQASARFYGDNFYGVPSPRGVPSVTPEQRDQYVDEMRSAAAGAAAPNFSEWYWDKYGAPPSYLTQGLASIANMMADLSMPAGYGANRLIQGISKKTAGSSIPLLTGYLNHIGRKTAVAPSMFMDSGDPLVAAGFQGVGTAGAPAVPSNWLDGSEEGRVDLTKPHLFRPYGLTSNDKHDGQSEGQVPIGEHMANYRKDAELAQKRIESESLNHPEHPSKLGPNTLGGVGWQLGKGITESSADWSDANKRSPVPMPFMIWR